MARCSYCNSTILFGGVKDESLRFCNARCHAKGAILLVAEKIPEDVVRQGVGEIHRGPCPRCGGAGPVDVHTSYSIWSAVLMTRWKNVPQLSCRSCGVKAQLKGAASSALLGWWGIPWGLLMTPVQVTRNLVSMARSPDPLQPSGELTRMVRLDRAARQVQSAQHGH